MQNQEANYCNVKIHALKVHITQQLLVQYLKKLPICIIKISPYTTVYTQHMTFYFISMNNNLSNVHTYPTNIPHSHGKFSKNRTHKVMTATSAIVGMSVSLIMMPNSFFKASRSRPSPARSMIFTKAISLYKILKL